MKRGYLVSISGAAVFVTALAGCSSGTGHNVEHGPEAGSAATAAAAPVKVVVGNKVLPVANEVACVDAADTVFVNLGNDEDAIALRLSSGESPTVQSLTVGRIDGRPLMYNESRGGTPPTVTKDGLTYKIVGTTSRTISGSTGNDLVKPFELEFTCPQRK